jgi:hypothetical protein
MIDVGMFRSGVAAKCSWQQFLTYILAKAFQARCGVEIIADGREGPGFISWHGIE